MDDSFAANQINSVDYWNRRFFEDWIANDGRRQTAFFAELCCRELPAWFIRTVRSQKLSIFDYGCALGDALPVLRVAFPNSTISGGDVAQVGLGLARALHPNFDFRHITAGDGAAGGNAATAADVIYCSNTLEHFETWPERLEQIARRARDYLLVMLPFEEDDRIDEHVFTFEFDSLPIRLDNNMRLLHLAVFDTADEPDTCWNGSQLIAIYGKKQAVADLRPAAGPAEAGSATAGSAAARPAADSLAFDLRGVKLRVLPKLLQNIAALSRVKRQSLRSEKDLAALLDERDAALRQAHAAAENSTALALANATRFAALLAAGEARETAMLADIDRRRAQAVQFAQQRDLAKLAAAEAVHSELIRLREALAAALRDAHDRAQEVERVQQELADIRKARNAAEWQAREREAEVEAAQRQLTEFRDRLAEAERRRSEQERAAADMRAAFGRRLFGRLLGHVRRRQINNALLQGGRAARNRDWPAAARYNQQVLRIAPDLTPIWVQLGHALKEQGDYGAAESAYRRALALDGSAADTLLQLGHLLKLQSRWEETADAYERALRLDPRLEDAGNELGALTQQLVDEGDKARDARNWSAASRCYRRALSRQPGLTPIWVQLGHALKEQGAYSEAEAAYRQALELDDSVADTHLQLGHLFKLQARRSQATRAYATAIRLDANLTAAREALQAFLGYSPSEAERAMLANGKASEADAHLLAAAGDPDAAGMPGGDEDGTDLAHRYGPLFPDASRKIGTGHDVIWLGVIDWHFRIQRPQHLATNLADRGARVFYISLVFEPAGEGGRFRIIDTPHLGVFEVRLRLETASTESIYRGLSKTAVREINLALDELVTALGIRAPVVMVEYPTWHDVAYGIAGATVVDDCLDLATGFSNAAKSLGAAEDELVAHADLVVAASQPLVEHVAKQRSSVLIRNAADVEFFAPARTDRVAGDKPVIGYFGAIAEWFNIEWIEHCAAARPDWQFRLIGRTDGCDTSRAERLPNVRFYGEKPYQELPGMLREFDVAVIPFKLVELIRCTNPVKLYEYMAAGKAVVAAPMPEVVAATDMVYIAEDAPSFLDRLTQAVAEDGPELRSRRQAWAREHNWANRAGELALAIDTALPLVSVIVLTYNNWDYTKACLFSLRSWSEYPNLEIIVVDNASTDGTREKLRELERQVPEMQVILNEGNLGFPAGNNVGVRAARGEYVILLNNDTYVTRGWVRDLIRPMQLDPRVGLVGPLTNKIGNEQKIRLAYGSMQEMQRAARRFVRRRLRRTLETRTLAFFCVAIRRSVLDEVGLLDESYGLGFFEDDDYCRRVEKANYKMVIADDVFVHHHLSVSFDTIGAKAGEQMARNRVLFEERWGPWQPHRYRDEPGFG